MNVASKKNAVWQLAACLTLAAVLLCVLVPHHHGGADVHAVAQFCAFCHAQRDMSACDLAVAVTLTPDDSQDELPRFTAPVSDLILATSPHLRAPPAA